MKKKILVLGSSSFSGASFIKHLLEKNNFEIFGTYRKNKKKSLLPYKFSKNYKTFKNFRIDFSKNNKLLEKLILKIKPEYIVDFASICMVNESWANSDYYYKVNVSSKIRLIKSICKYNFLKKYIYISTPEIFGSSQKFIDENYSNYNPSTPYANSKLLAEIILTNFQKKNLVPLIIARFSNFYGPGQPLYRLIPKIIACIDNNKKFPIQGNGKAKRNFIYSNDFCDGIYRTIVKGKVGKIYHFSGREFKNILEIVNAVCDLKSHKITNLIVRKRARISEDLVYKLSSKKTEIELKWKPKFNLKRGLKEMIIYHNRHFKKIANNELIYLDKNLKK